MSEKATVLELREVLAKEPEGIYTAAFRSVLRNPIGRAGLIIVGIFVLAALITPVIAPYDPIKIYPGEELLPPSSRYLFGTDELGRDLLSRILYGSRVAFTVGLLAVLLASLVGAFSGLIAGYAGGIVDSLIMRFWDMIMAFPSILMGVAVISVLGPGAAQSAVALAVINFPRFSRLARGNVLSEKEKDYVTAARAMGVPPLSILIRHITPNVLASLLVQFALALVAAVLMEASLSFLGLGTQPPQPSWGSMLRTSRTYLRVAPWYGVFPGMAITLLLLGLNFLADALRDALDPTRIRRLA